MAGLYGGRGVAHYRYSQFCVRLKQALAESSTPEAPAHQSWLAGLRDQADFPGKTLTPVATDIAHQLDVPHEAFTVAVILATNCSYASPVGYQTNLHVMGPGHYRFTDFTRAGTPLILLLWMTFSLFAPWCYGLPY